MTANLKTDSSSRIKTTTIRVLIAILLIEALIWAGTVIFEKPSAFGIGMSLTTRFNLMFWVIAGVLIASILAFRCMEKEQGLARIMAIVGLVSCAIAAILQLTLIWGLIGFVESNGLFSYGISVMGKLMLAAMTTTVAAIGGAFVLRIEENGTSIASLKYTAFICGICFWLVTIFMIFADTSNLSSLVTKGLPLSGVMLAAFVVTCITAVLLSWFNRRDRIEAALVRVDEMGSKDTGADFDQIIETSAKERMARKAELEARPPLQDEELAPVVARDNEINAAIPLAPAAPVPEIPETPETPEVPETPTTPAESEVPATAPVDLSAPATAPVDLSAPIVKQDGKKEEKKELPPLQDESMAPTVTHEGGPKIVQANSAANNSSVVPGGNV